jgi:hypothetical protein
MRALVFIISLGTLNFSYAQLNQSQRLLDSICWSQMGLDVLEPFDSNYNYSISDTIEFKRTHVVVVERSYPEEYYQWMCIFDHNNEIISFLVTAYNNADGGLIIESSIEGDVLKKNTSNSYQIPSEINESFRVKRKRFIQK